MFFKLSTFGLILLNNENILLLFFIKLFIISIDLSGFIMDKCKRI